MSSTELLLKFSAAICWFFFGKKIHYFLLCAIIFLYAPGASAFFSNGRIDDDFSYRSLRVEMIKTKSGGCILEGEILNKTSIIQEDISVTFYAYDFFDHALWKEIVHIDIVDPFYNGGKGYYFRKKLRRCDMPAKFQFKVSGVKKKDVKKVIKDKPKNKPSNPKTNPEPSPKSNTENSESMGSLEKRDSGAVDFITTPVVPTQKYLITLTNGKLIITESCRELDDDVVFYQNGGEVRISKDKVSEIRKQD